MKHTGLERIGRTVTIKAAKRQCLDKKGFASRNIARDKAARGKKKYGSEQEPYRCTLCGKWHLATVREPQRIIAPQYGRHERSKAAP